MTVFHEAETHALPIFKFREAGDLTIALNGEPDLLGNERKPSR